MRDAIKLICLSLLLFGLFLANEGYAARPNIVVILCDDLGSGDVGAYNPNCKIATPEMDHLAKEGILFTDAHSSSSVCTPTRYSLLTGRYNWRSKLQSGVLGGMSPRLIEPNLATIASFLQQQDYHSACIGKWHLGMNWVLKPQAAGFANSIEKGDDGWRADFTKPFSDGPLTVGFDYYFGISASLDMVPYTFLENDRVTVVPTTDQAFPMMLGKSQGQTRRGPAAMGFEAEDVLPKLTEKAVDYIASRSEAAKQGTPFFLYLPYASPHTPILPTKAWQGRSDLNPYADFVMQTDAAIGQVKQAIDQHGLTDNTLFIVTSDNGCSPQADYPALLAKGHNPSHVYRGHKADIFEGGHRVPYLARWPGKLAAGTRCDALVGLQDTFATIADAVGAKLPENVAVDSFSWLPHVSDSKQPTRTALVHHSINGSFAIRRAQWKLCFCGDSGGWSEPRPGRNKDKTLSAIQLFDLVSDIGETNNVADAHPEVVAELTDQMKQLIDEGRSTPGPTQSNTTTVRWQNPLEKQ